MLNKYFLVSFVCVFSTLVLLSRFLDSKLKQAGYDYRNLILLGLPGHEMPFDLLKDAVPNYLHAVDIPYLGTYDLVAITSSPTFIITGAIVLTTAFLANVLLSRNLALISSLNFISPPTHQVAPSPWIHTYGKTSPSRRRSRFHPTQPCVSHFFFSHSRILVHACTATVSNFHVPRMF